jgi:hypothetical protein
MAIRISTEERSLQTVIRVGHGYKDIDRGVEPSDSG